MHMKEHVHRGMLGCGTTIRTMRLLVLAICLLLASCFVRAGGLDDVLDPIAPDIKNWASVCIVTDGADGKPVFTWHDYRDTENKTDFWPASTIKLYTVIAALERMGNTTAFMDAAVKFEHREADGRWVVDSA